MLLLNWIVFERRLLAGGEAGVNTKGFLPSSFRWQISTDVQYDSTDAVARSCNAASRHELNCHARGSAGITHYWKPRIRHIADPAKRCWVIHLPGASWMCVRQHQPEGLSLCHVRVWVNVLEVASMRVSKTHRRYDVAVAICRERPGEEERRRPG